MTPIGLYHALLAVCCVGMLPSQAMARAPAEIAMPTDAEVSARAQALLEQMTVEEKAGQLSQYFYFGPLVPPLAKPAEDAVAQARAGSILFSADAAANNRMQKLAVEQTRLKIPLLMGFDVIHGLRTIFPVPLGMAASWDPALAEKAQAVAAAEARAVGIHWAFAPMVDVSRDARWGRIVEGAGEDSYLGSAMAAAQVRGFQGDRIGAPGRVIAGPKHFAGYGAAPGGRDYDEAEVSDSELWNVHFPPFKAAIDAGAGNIMSAYMALNGVPATGNKWLLTDVLRKTWGFKGWVVSDAGATEALTTHGLTADAADAARRALDAGVDMEMIPPPAFKSVMGTIPASVAAGRVSVTQLDSAVLRILEAKIRMGLFENPYVDEARVESVLSDPAHRIAARVAAERSAVLLRNEGGLLPLDAKKLKSLAVIGPLADSARDTLGSWVFPFQKPSAVTVLSGLRAKLGDKVRVEYSEGVRMPARLHPSMFASMDRAEPKPPLDETAEIARAVGLAQNADVAVLVLGEGQEMSGEGASRASFALPGRQQELLDAVVATGKPVVVVLMNGRPLDLGETKAGAILETWYPGSEGGPAIANLLFGDAVPGGKLPLTWVRSAAQAPMHYARLVSHDEANAQKRYWDTPNAPTWEFGHGLSYTTFAYENLKVAQPTIGVGKTLAVTVDLINTGKRTCDEVAQLYIHQRSGEASRPIRELKGFQRVTLKPGEKRTLRFELGPDELRYWSAVSRDWVQDAAAFDVWVGSSSNATLATTFEVTD